MENKFVCFMAIVTNFRILLISLSFFLNLKEIMNKSTDNVSVKIPSLPKKNMMWKYHLDNDGKEECGGGW